MADRDPGDERPSLELPKLGWRRNRPPKATAPTPEPPPTAVAAPPPAPRLEETRPIAVEEPEPLPEPLPQPVPEPAPDPEPVVRKERGPGGMLAAVLVGLVVGLGVVGLTWASLQGCSSVQGTSSCGKAGYPLLMIILAAMVAVGALLLRLARVAEAVATSFLGLGLTSVLALLLLVDSLEDPSMVAVIPLLNAAAFAAAHWVTSTFIEPAPD